MVKSLWICRRERTERIFGELFEITKFPFTIEELEHVVDKGLWEYETNCPHCKKFLKKLQKLVKELKK